MKTIFIICFILQGSSWRVKDVEKNGNIYTVEVSKKDTINNVPGTTYRVYSTDMKKCPEKLWTN